MNYQRHKEVHLTARNEGKLKVYESCSDLRAWSHDAVVRDYYIKEWMKADMPSCMIPFEVISKFWKNMTYKKSLQLAPRCNQNCRSKVLFESIYLICNAIKECLRNDKSFEKFFVEEEFETSNWPYEKCMEPLKNITMFWKIIAEKIFHLRLPKNNEIIEIKCDRDNSMRSIIKDWEKDILEQIAFAKCLKNKELDTNAKHRVKYKFNSSGDFYIPCEDSNTKSSSADIYPNNLNYSKRSRKCRSVTSRYTSIKVKTAEVACNTVNCTNIDSYSQNIEYLQYKLNQQAAELKRLNRENRSLRIELKNPNKKLICKRGYYPNVDTDMAMALPLPFDYCMEDDIEQNDLIPKDTESEMIITMKNCNNNNFKHISLLQVVHKSNSPVSQEMMNTENITRRGGKENPIQLLNSVNNRFGSILRRELAIANASTSSKENISVHASYKSLNAGKSKSSILSSSSSHVMSTNNSSAC